MKTADKYLDKAKETINNRGKEYDKEQERSMGKCIQAFNIITGKNLTESEGWLLLQILKDVRQWTCNSHHEDSAIDCIAYAALKAESQCSKAVGDDIVQYISYPCSKT